MTDNVAFSRPCHSLCTDLVLFVEFVPGREKPRDVLGHFHILLQKNKTQIKLKQLAVFIGNQEQFCTCIYLLAPCRIFLEKLPTRKPWKSMYVCVLCVYCVCWDLTQTQHSLCEKWWCRLGLLSQPWWLIYCELWCQCPSTFHKHRNMHARIYIFPQLI